MYLKILMYSHIPFFGLDGFDTGIDEIRIKTLNSALRERVALN